MIRIILGGVGSGKTAMIVREMFLSNSSYYSNILSKKIKNNNQISRDMIFKKELISTKRDGTPVYKTKLNIGFWKNLNRIGSLNIVLDEAHTLMNPRRGMSQTSIVMMDFVALLRRILGESSSGYGELILITQLERRIDIIAKEMSTKIQFCRCHYARKCSCGFTCFETNETPEPKKICPNCNKKTKRSDFVIEVYSFINIDAYNFWNLYGAHAYYDRYYIMDIEKYFPMYNTLQWENLITDD